MKTSAKHLLLYGILTGCCMISQPVISESTWGTPTADNTLSATARLNLKVVIPRFLSFQIGSRGEAVDTLSIEPLPDKMGDGTVVSATAGDAAAGSGASVNLRSNAGQITLTATNDGGIGGLGSRGAISLVEISALNDTPVLAAPTLTDAAGSTSRMTLTRGNITDLAATWRYEYRNLHAVDPGTYRAEIIYTAASP